MGNWEGDVIRKCKKGTNVKNAFLFLVLRTYKFYLLFLCLLITKNNLSAPPWIIEYAKFLKCMIAQSFTQNFKDSQYQESLICRHYLVRTKNSRIGIEQEFLTISGLEMQGFVVLAIFEILIIHQSKNLQYQRSVEFQNIYIIRMLSLFLLAVISRICDIGDLWY